MIEDDFIVGSDDLLLITGSNGFIGPRVVEALLRYGFRNLRCFARPTSDLTALNEVIDSFGKVGIEVFKGNLLSPDDCRRAVEGVSVVFHLATAVEGTFPGCFMSSVVTTRNLLDSVLEDKGLERFLNVSSFAVYSNLRIARGGVLDETCEVESQFMQRYEPYVFAKAKQDELVLQYHKKHGIRYVIVRPGFVYGPGRETISARVGIGTFGFFLHLGGSNRIPLTYVDNCADAIVLAGTKKSVEGEIFNVVDDDLPRSREFLRMYKKNVVHFGSIYVPHSVFHLFCCLWERYSAWSEGQLPPVFNRRTWAANWKGNRYSNKKLKDLLGWQPKVSCDEGLKRYFGSLSEIGQSK